MSIETEALPLSKDSDSARFEQAVYDVVMDNATDPDSELSKTASLKNLQFSTGDALTVRYELERKTNISLFDFTAQRILDCSQADLARILAERSAQ